MMGLMVEGRYKQQERLTLYTNLWTSVASSVQLESKNAIRGTPYPSLQVPATSMLSCAPFVEMPSITCTSALGSACNVVRQLGLAK